MPQNRFSLYDQMDNSVSLLSARRNLQLFRMTIPLDVSEQDFLLLTQAARLWYLSISNQGTFDGWINSIREEFAKDTLRVLEQGDSELTIDDLQNIEKGLNAWANLNIFEGGETARKRARSDLEENDPLMIDLPSEVGRRLFDIIALREEHLRFRQKAKGFLEELE